MNHTQRFKQWSVVMLSATIMIVGSEKMYWYPQGFPDFSHVELLAAYSLGVAALFYTIRRFGVTGLAGVTLAMGIYCLVVEGAVTPVIYEDGPFPALFLYFLGWHGLVAVVFLWYGVRRLALERRRLTLGVISTVTGLVFGLWSTTYWRADSVEEYAALGQWDAGQWSNGRFGAYAFLLAAILFCGHLALDKVWVDRWQPSVWGTRVLFFITLGLVALWTIVIPWAPVKFALLGWLVWKVIRRPTFAVRDGAIAWLPELSGSIRARDMLPVLLVAPSAVAIYAWVATIDPSDSALGQLFEAISALTVVVGLVTFIWAARDWRRSTHLQGDDLQGDGHLSPLLVEAVD